MVERPRTRAQASLPALAIALLILSSVTVMAIAVADGALASANREPDERHAATSVANRLVAAGSPTTIRENVINRSALQSLNGSAIRSRFPVVADESVSVRIGDRSIIADSEVHGGSTVRRLVVVSRTERRSITPSFGGRNAVTVPRRTDEATLTLQPPNGTTISSVRANGRVLLYDPAGLEGEYALDLSRFETTRLRFDGPGPLHRGNATIDYSVEQTTRATLAVTVDG